VALLRAEAVLESLELSDNQRFGVNIQHHAAIAYPRLNRVSM
jgi:hypothetical protein